MVLENEEEMYNKLYTYFYNSFVESRNLDIQRIKERNFEELHFYNRKEVIQVIESSLLTDIIEELKKINSSILPNQSPIHIFSFTINEEDENSLYASSYLYEPVSIDKCQSMAKHSANGAIWKIKYQPLGRDTKGYLKILES